MKKNHRDISIRSAEEKPKTQGTQPFFQAKLQVNEPGDVYEQEADAMADKIMQSKEAATGQSFFKPAEPSVQRKCKHCEEEEKEQVQRKETGNKDQKNNTKEFAGNIEGGQSLSPELKNFYEPHFGQDFSNVKIHTGTVAAKSAQSVNALAYTTGNNIVFNEGQYSPHTDAGKKLLGHELTHVVQQGASSQKNTLQRKPVDGSSDDLHDPILDDFSKETGTPREEASQHSPDYEKWLQGSAADQLVSSLQLKAADLNNPEILARFNRMTLEQLYQYRDDYILNGANDKAVVKHITDLMLAQPLQKCSPAQIATANQKAQAALATMAGLVKNADRALTLLLSEWVNNKAVLLNKQFAFGGEVACAFRSNFNVDETSPDFGTSAIRVSSRISQLQRRLSRPVNFTCEGINHPVCLAGTGMDAQAFVVNHQDPVHLCMGFYTSMDTVSEQAIIAHELLHFLPGLGDDGGYSVMGAQLMTCGTGLKFSAATKSLINSADSIAGFIMHIDQTSPTDLQVIKRVP